MRELKRLAIVTGAMVAFSLAGATHASSMLWRAGTVGTETVGSVEAWSTAHTTIHDVVLGVHAGTFGAGVFEANVANVFLVDLGGDAGLTLIATWGTDAIDPNDSFHAQVTVTHRMPPGPSSGIGEGSYDSDPGGINKSHPTFGGPFGNPVPTAGVTEGFVFGSAFYSSGISGDITLDVVDPLPVGFAISNLLDGGFTDLHADFLEMVFTGMSGDITEWKLFDSDGTVLFTGGAGDHLILAVPLPAPVWMGLAGLAGVVVLRRRIA